MANKTTAFLTISKERAARIVTLEVESYEVTDSTNDEIVIQKKDTSGFGTSHYWRATLYDWTPPDPTAGDGARIDFRTDKADWFREVLKHEVED